MSKWTRARRRKNAAALHELCAYCGVRVPPNQEVFGFGAKGLPGAPIDGYKGEAIEILVQSLGRLVPTIVTSDDSPAKRQGFDLYFMTCSEGCTADLKAALEKDIEDASLE